MPDDELRITRRLFLQHSAMATAMTAAWYSIAMKADAVASAQETAQTFRTFPDTVSPYAYDDFPS